jgi:formate-dependent phosphoribosylglycinamide formyltransferase (GAR transformylase)
MTVVLFATPFFTANAQSFINALSALPEVRLGVISQAPFDELAPELRERVAAHWRVEDALDSRQLTAAARGLADRLGPLHRLLAVNEQIQVPLAEARERLGVPGMRAEQANNFRDKARMKALLREAGLPCARYRLVPSESEAWRFADEVGYPMVAKPPAGAASQATYRVTGPEVLGEVLRQATPVPGRELLLEEFVTGEEFSFDTFSLEGRVVFHSITRYDPTPLEVMRNPWIQWTVLLPREIDAPEFDPIREIGARAIRVLGMETGMCHLEWFRRADGSVVLSEVGARPPGAQITTLISRAHDFNSVDAWSRLMVFGTWDAPSERRYAAGAAFLRGQGTGRVRAVHGIDQVQQELGSLVTDARLPEVGQAAATTYEGEGFILVRHPETTVVADALRRIVSLVRVELGE